MVFVTAMEQKVQHVSYIAAGHRQRVIIGQNYVYKLKVWILIKDFIRETLYVSASLLF